MAIVDPSKANQDSGRALGNTVTEFREFDLIPVDKGQGPPCEKVVLRIERFTCRCPITTQPDHAEVVITYGPDAHYLETKSLKLYVESYRDKGIFHEHLASRILTDIDLALKPAWMKVKVKFDSRGGIAVDALALSWTPGPDDEVEA